MSILPPPAMSSNSLQGLNDYSTVAVANSFASSEPMKSVAREISPTSDSPTDEITVISDDDDVKETSQPLSSGQIEREDLKREAEEPKELEELDVPMDIEDDKHDKIENDKKGENENKKTSSEEIQESSTPSDSRSTEENRPVVKPVPAVRATNVAAVQPLAVRNTPRILQDTARTMAPQSTNIAQQNQSLLFPVQHSFLQTPQFFLNPVVGSVAGTRNILSSSSALGNSLINPNSRVSFPTTNFLGPITGQRKPTQQLTATSPDAGGEITNAGGTANKFPVITEKELAEVVNHICVNCSATETFRWRVWARDSSGKVSSIICNACGLHYAKYGDHRPQGLWGNEKKFRSRKATKFQESGAAVEAKLESKGEGPIEKKEIVKIDPKTITVEDFTRDFFSLIRDSLKENLYSSDTFHTPAELVFQSLENIRGKVIFSLAENRRSVKIQTSKTPKAETKSETKSERKSETKSEAKSEKPKVEGDKKTLYEMLELYFTKYKVNEDTKSENFLALFENLTPKSSEGITAESDRIHVVRLLRQVIIEGLKLGGIKEKLISSNLNRMHLERWMEFFRRKHDWRSFYYLFTFLNALDTNYESIHKATDLVKALSKYKKIILAEEQEKALNGQEQKWIDRLKDMAGEIYFRWADVVKEHKRSIRNEESPRQRLQNGNAKLVAAAGKSGTAPAKVLTKLSESENHDTKKRNASAASLDDDDMFGEIEISVRPTKKVVSQIVKENEKDEENNKELKNRIDLDAPTSLSPLNATATISVPEGIHYGKQDKEAVGDKSREEGRNVDAPKRKRVHFAPPDKLVQIKYIENKADIVYEDVPDAPEGKEEQNYGAGENLEDVDVGYDGYEKFHLPPEKMRTEAEVDERRMKQLLIQKGLERMEADIPFLPPSQLIVERSENDAEYVGKHVTEFDEYERKHPPRMPLTEADSPDETVVTRSDIRIDVFEIPLTATEDVSATEQAPFLSFSTPPPHPPPPPPTTNEIGGARLYLDRNIQNFVDSVTESDPPTGSNRGDNENFRGDYRDYDRERERNRHRARGESRRTKKARKREGGGICSFYRSERGCIKGANCDRKHI